MQTTIPPVVSERFRLLVGRDVGKRVFFQMLSLRLKWPTSSWPVRSRFSGWLIVSVHALTRAKTGLRAIIATVETIPIQLLDAPRIVAGMAQ